MTSRLSVVLWISVGFLAASVLAAVVIWNPGQWAWTNRLLPSRQADQQALSSMTAPAGAAQAGRKVLYWRDPMDPTMVSDKPGKSPMGMEMVPVYEGEGTAETGVRVNPNFVQNFAVRTAEAKRGNIPIEIRTVGILAYNQKGIASINTKFDGWIERPQVNYVGESVQRGQVLFEVYSPQLVTTQQEYLSAIDYLERLSASGAYPEAVERARALVEASRERLRYWDISDEQIRELARSGKTTRTLQVVSGVSGVVIQKMDQSLDGMRLGPGMNVYKIADLSTIWVEIEVFEYQVQHLRLGQTARIELDAFPGQNWQGTLIYLDPAVNSKTRTLKAYVEIPNPDRKLRPEMYANVRIQAPAASGVVIVPQEAVIHSGERNVVIVHKDQRFEPRQVELGVQGGGYQEVRRGLQAGELVVTSSQFLIDSESNLKEAINKMLGASGQETETTPAPMNH
jgi:membrane fusion protein, copper/silver efflux system